MSRENVEIVRRGYEAFNRGDFAAVLMSFAEDIEYVTSGVIPDTPDVYRGKQEVGRALAQGFWSQFDEARIEVHELMAVGDCVVVSSTARGRGKQSGVEASQGLCHVWTLRGGKAVRGQAFPSKSEALGAIGLEE